MPPCDVSREQALQRIFPGCLSFVFDEATGGPLTCTPGQDPQCAFVDDECTTAPISLPVGAQATLGIGLHDDCNNGIGVNIASIVLLDADAAFVLLEPIPTSFFDDGFFFVGVAPAVEGTIEARIEVTSDARNVGEGAGVASFRLVVDGTLP